ncbi:MFS transporter [Tistrella bauzanensis]
MTMAIQMIATGGVLALSTMAPTVAAALGVNPELIGYQVSLIYLTAAISSVTAGGMVRKFGAARVSQASMATFVVALLCFGSGHLALMAMGAALCGLGYGLNNPAASHILIRVTPPARRNTVFSIKQAGVPLGGVAAGLCFPALAALISWQAGLWLAALMPMLLIVLLARLRPSWDADRMPEARIGQDWTLGARLAMKLAPCARSACWACCIPCCNCRCRPSPSPCW